MLVAAGRNPEPGLARAVELDERDRLASPLAPDGERGIDDVAPHPYVPPPVSALPPRGGRLEHSAHAHEHPPANRTLGLLPPHDGRPWELSWRQRHRNARRGAAPGARVHAWRRSPVAEEVRLGACPDDYQLGTGSKGPGARGNVRRETVASPLPGRPCVDVEVAQAAVGRDRRAKERAIDDPGRRARPGSRRLRGDERGGNQNEYESSHRGGG